MNNNCWRVVRAAGSVVVAWAFVAAAVPAVSYAEGLVEEAPAEVAQISELEAPVEVELAEEEAAGTGQDDKLGAPDESGLSAAEPAPAPTSEQNGLTFSPLAVLPGEAVEVSGHCSYLGMASDVVIAGISSLPALSGLPYYTFYLEVDQETGAVNGTMIVPEGAVPGDYAISWYCFLEDIVFAMNEAPIPFEVLGSGPVVTPTPPATPTTPPAPAAPATPAGGAVSPVPQVAEPQRPKQLAATGSGGVDELFGAGLLLAAVGLVGVAGARSRQNRRAPSPSKR